MKKRSLIIILFFLFILCSCTPTIQQLQKENKRLVTENEQLQLKQEQLLSLFSELTLEITKANVMIYTYCYKTVFGIKYEAVGGQGSGVIISENSGYYYVLTNNHVVYGDPSYPTREYKVFDYKMNEYSGKLISAEPDYDLAIIRFTKRIDLLELSLASNNPVKDEVVIAIGQPEGQLNAITFGKVIDYIIPNCSTCKPLESNVQFSCLYHDAYTYHGNSGGMLVNEQKQIVGINTFGSEKTNHSLAIPVIKIKEFLTNIRFDQ